MGPTFPLPGEIEPLGTCHEASPCEVVPICGLSLLDRDVEPRHPTVPLCFDRNARNHCSSITRLNSNL